MNALEQTRQRLIKQVLGTNYTLRMEVLKEVDPVKAEQLLSRAVLKESIWGGYEVIVPNIREIKDYLDYRF